MFGKKSGGGGGSTGGKKPGNESPARRLPTPSCPPGSPHPVGGSLSNTRVSHNKEAVLQDADLGTFGKHGLCRSISNSNSEAVGNDAGLGTVKNGHRSSTSNPSASPHSGGAGAIKLHGLFYPHPDKLADFKSFVSGDFKPYRLLADVKFRDTLITF